jgi:hypothetical protein
MSATIKLITTKAREIGLFSYKLNQYPGWPPDRWPQGSAAVTPAEHDIGQLSANSRRACAFTLKYADSALILTFNLSLICWSTDFRWASPIMKTKCH